MSDLIPSQDQSADESNDCVIQLGSQVTLHFSLLMPNGDEIDSTRNGKPATFVVGDGSLLPGFEAVLMGQQKGYSAQVLVPAASGFGERNPKNVQLLDRSRFAGFVGDQPLEEGLMISFAAPDGELPGVITKLFDQTIEVDFNHPLSGIDITFDVAVLKVEDLNA